MTWSSSRFVHQNHNSMRILIYSYLLTKLRFETLPYFENEIKPSLLLFYYGEMNRKVAFFLQKITYTSVDYKSAFSLNFYRKFRLT
jgi:hypothetical protein